MKRITILLVALLALVVSACGGEETTESAAASEPVASIETTPEPTPEPTPEEEESAEPDESEGTGGLGGTDTALLDLLPDEIGGQSRIDVDLASNPMFAAALEAQGMDASEVEYIVSTYGSGEGVLAVTAMRIPEMGQTQLEQMARLMTGMADGQGSADVVTIGGKEVVAINATDVEQTAYLYFLDGAVFVVGGTSEDLAAELFSQLP